MRISSLPSYLAPGTLPNGATKAAQFLHSLRHSTGTAVGILDDVERNKAAFDKCDENDRKEAGKLLGYEPELILKAADSLLQARPAPDPVQPEESKLSPKPPKAK
jgi:hypothetical protein